MVIATRGGQETKETEKGIVIGIGMVVVTETGEQGMGAMTMGGVSVGEVVREALDGVNVASEIGMEEVCLQAALWYIIAYNILYRQAGRLSKGQQTTRPRRR